MSPLKHSVSSGVGNAPISRRDMTQDSDDPYAPPQSCPGGVENKGNPVHYWVEGENLHVAQGANLPDVCLVTGQSAGEIRRIHRIIRWQPDHAFLYLAIILLLGSFFLRMLLLPLMVVVGGLVLRRLWSSISLSYGLERKAHRKQWWFGLAGWGFVAGALVFVVFTPFDPEERLVFGGAVAMTGLFILRRLDRSFRVVRIKKQVAVLSGIHPEALDYLRAWREMRLSRLLPPEFGPTDSHSDPISKGEQYGGPSNGRALSRG